MNPKLLAKILRVFAGPTAKNSHLPPRGVSGGHDIVTVGVEAGLLRGRGLLIEPAELRRGMRGPCQACDSTTAPHGRILIFRDPESALPRRTCRFEARSGRTTRTRTDGGLRPASLTCAARAFRASSTAFDHFRCSTGTRTGTSPARRFVGARRIAGAVEQGRAVGSQLLALVLAVG